MLIILIGDYFITSQVFNPVFRGGGGGGCEINTVVIVPYIKTQKTKQNELGQYSDIWTSRLVKRDL